MYEEFEQKHFHRGTCNVKAKICFSNFSKEKLRKKDKNSMFQALSVSVTLGIRIPSTTNMGFSEEVQPTTVSVG